MQHFEGVLSGLRAAGLEPRYVHASGTIPVAYGRSKAWWNLVRPGHAIYGYVSPARGSAPKRQLMVRPALSWKASVLAVKDLEAGALVGYGGIHRAARTMRIAILAAGYADGIPHRLSNRGHVIAQGKLAPIIGAVSMDLTTIDITSSPQLRVGDAVTLLGSEGDLSIDAQQMARLGSLEASDQNGFPHGVGVHRFHDVRAARVGAQRKLRVQGIQLQRVVMVRVDRGVAGTHVPDVPDSLGLDRAIGQLRVRGEAAGQTARGSRNIEHDPMEHVVRPAIQRVVRIVHDQNEALGALGHVGPFEPG
jgi:hypothetical protein